MYDTEFEDFDGLIRVLYMPYYEKNTYKKERIDMKRYFVLMQTKNFYHTFRTNSFGLAKWMADLKFWKYAKIHDAKASDVNLPMSKCIYINDRRG